MDSSKLVVTHYPISRFHKFEDMIYDECKNLNSNWSNDETKNNSLAYVVNNRLSHFSITTYEGKFINFSGMYKSADNWIIGGVRGFSSESHGIRVLKSIWVSTVFPAQYEFCKQIYSDCEGYMVTFNDLRVIELAKKYASRENTSDQNFVDFYNKCIVSTETEIIQHTPQYTMKWKFDELE